MTFSAPCLSTSHFLARGRFRKRNLKHAKECSIQQRRGFACGVCRWKRRFGCSRNSAVSAARFESGFRERDGQGQHWRGPHSHGGFLKMIVCESGGHANGLTYFIFRFLRRPLARAKYFSPLGSSIVLKYSGLAPIKYSTAKTASARCLAGMRLLMPSETSLAVLISCKFSWERLGSALGVLRVL